MNKKITFILPILISGALSQSALAQCQWNIVISPTISASNQEEVEDLIGRYTQIISSEKESNGDIFIEALFRADDVASAKEGCETGNQVIRRLNSFPGVKAVCFLDYIRPLPRLSGSN